jgi:hypothetical protein
MTKEFSSHLRNPSWIQAQERCSYVSEDSGNTKFTFLKVLKGECLIFEK